PAPVPPAAPPAPPPLAVEVPEGEDPLLVQLEAQVAAHPNHQDGYLAYADYLVARGDPRGELVGIGRELAKNPGDKKMLAAHAERATDILGPLADCDDLMTEVEWFMGFIKRARVAYTTERFNGEGEQVDLADLVGWLVDDPGPGRFLQHLTVGLV